jgi:hypothetical protein
MMSLKSLPYAIALSALCYSPIGAQSASQAAIHALDQAEVIALAPKVRTIRATPGTITLRVGQTIPFSAITITVVDSTGRDRGKLVGYDFSIKPGEPAEAIPRQITGKRAGETDFVVRYPRTAWKPRADPRAEAKVHVIVKP